MDGNETRISFGLAVSPSIKQFSTLNRGGVASGYVTVTNALDKDVEITLKPYSKNISQKDGASYFLEENSYKFGLKDWISFDNSEFKLKKGESKRIDYKIKIPLTAEPGGKYAVLLFNIVRVTSKKEAENMAINQGVGHVIITRVEGKIIENSEFVSFKTDKKVYFNWPKDKVKFLYYIKNKGTVEEIVGGNIFIYKTDITKSFKNLVVNAGKKMVLPENERILTEEWIPSSRFIATSDNGVEINTDFFRFGKFRATIKLKHYKDGQRVTSEKYYDFWLLPWYMLAFLILFMISFAIAVKYVIMKKS